MMRLTSHNLAPLMFVPFVFVLGILKWKNPFLPFTKIYSSEFCENIQSVSGCLAQFGSIFIKTVFTLAVNNLYSTGDFTLVFLFALLDTTLLLSNFVQTVYRF